jgi:cyclase
MNKKRIIARIDVKNEHVIKGIHLEGLRKVGNPNEMAKKYYNEGIDEIIFMDAVAAYYDRNSLTEIINRACENVFVPITVGGGIRKIKDIQIALNAGADKIAINTQAVKDPSFLTRASEIFGSQCIVSSIDAKKISENKWEVYIDNGREPTGMDVVEWAKKVEDLGAGEIMLTSVDKEGTKRGFDIELYNAISEVVSIPTICCGGAGKKEHIADVISNKGVDAVALASVLHYNIESIKNLKEFLTNNKKNYIRQ